MNEGEYREGSVVENLEFMTLYIYPDSFLI